MCNPAAIIPIALGAGSGLLQGQAGVRQADSQADALRRNAVYMSRAADDAKLRGIRDADMARVEGQQFIGAQRAAMAGSGGVVDSGSNAILAQDTAQLAEFDALTIMNNAAREAYGYQVQADDNVRTAKNLQKQARKDRLTSILGGVLQGGIGAFTSGAFSGAGAGGVNLQGQAAPLTNNAAFVKMM